MMYGFSPPPTEIEVYPDIALQSRLVADGRGFAPIPWVGTHGCVLSPLRGSIWCVALPWVTLRSTHGCDISPLCGSMWLPCNNYALCIMNYALKKAHGWDPITANAVPSGICICFKLSALGFKLREAVNYELFCFSNPLCFLYQNQN